MGTAVMAGLLAGYGIAMPIGAIAVFLINLGATACLCISAAAGLGAATVDGGMALAAVAGGTGFARQVQAAAGPVHWAAGAVLTVVAGWTGPPSVDTAPQRPRPGQCCGCARHCAPTPRWPASPCSIR